MSSDRVTVLWLKDSSDMIHVSLSQEMDRSRPYELYFKTPDNVVKRCKRILHSGQYIYVDINIPKWKIPKEIK